MSDWKEHRLEDLCERITVGFVGKMSNQYRDNGVPFLRSQNIQPFRVERDGILNIDEKFEERIKKSRLRSGDVAVIRTGYPGTAAVIPPDLDGSNCADLVVITPSAEINPYFLAAVFNSAWGRSHVQGQLVGSAQQHFNVGSARAMRVPLPDRSGQNRIADVLCRLNDLIENNRRRIEVLEEMAQAIYREWFVHFRFPGHEDATFIESHLGPIPEGWEARMFGDLVDLQKTTVDPDEIPAGSVLVGLEHIPRRQLTLDSWEESSEVGSRKARFAKGDILFGKIRPYFHKVSLAPTDGYCSPDALVIRAKPGLEALATSTAFSKEFVDLASATANGTKMPRASWEVLASHPVAVPPPEMLKQFAEAFIPSVTKCQVLMYENKSLRALRDLLLPKLVSGEIDASQLDLDALLEGAV